MVPFADYELPVQYEAGPNAEHRSVRTAAGVFDIDHMGQFAVSGEDALAYLQYVQVADVATPTSLDSGEARRGGRVGSPLQPALLRRRHDR